MPDESKVVRFLDWITRANSPKANSPEVINRRRKEADNHGIEWAVYSLLTAAAVGVAVNAAINSEPPKEPPKLEDSPAVEQILEMPEYGNANDFRIMTSRNGEQVLLSFMLPEKRSCVAVVSDEMFDPDRGIPFNFPQRILSKDPIAICTE